MEDGTIRASGTAGKLQRPAAVLITVLLASAVLGAPLAFGATQVWAYCALQVLIALAAMLWVFIGAGRGGHLWCLVALLALGILQMIPLPRPLLSSIAPLSQIPLESQRLCDDVPVHRTVSIDAERTFAAWRRGLALAMVVAVAASLCRNVRFRQWLLKSVAVGGVVILALGLAVGAGKNGKVLGFHDMSGRIKAYKNPLLSAFHSQGTGYADVGAVGKIRYVTESPIVGSAVGAMINANHFAAWVGMTLPIVVGLLLARAARANAWAWRSLAGAYAGAALYAVIVPAAALAATISIALSSTAVVILALAHSRGRTTQAMAAGAGALLLAAVAFSRLNELPGFAEGRLRAWLDGGKMLAASPWLGVGYGNYRTAYPSFAVGQPWYFAHGTWQEWAAEMGLAGLLALAVLLVWFLRLLRRARWTGLTPGRRVERWSILAALVFAAIQGAMDHGVQIPANAYLCALLLGLSIADLTSDSPLAGDVHHPERTTPVMPWSGRLAVLGLAVVLVWGAVRETTADRLARPLREALVDQLLSNERLPVAKKRERLLAALPAAEKAAEMTPRSADIANHIAQAHLYLSGGSEHEELRLAAAWYCRSEALRPLSPWTRTTLADIRRVLDERPSPGKDRASRALR